MAITVWGFSFFHHPLEGPITMKETKYTNPHVRIQLSNFFFSNLFTPACLGQQHFQIHTSTSAVCSIRFFFLPVCVTSTRMACRLLISMRWHWTWHQHQQGPHHPFPRAPALPPGMFTTCTSWRGCWGVQWSSLSPRAWAHLPCPGFVMGGRRGLFVW